MNKTSSTFLNDYLQHSIMNINKKGNNSHSYLKKNYSRQGGQANPRTQESMMSHRQINYSNITPKSSSRQQIHEQISLLSNQRLMLVRKTQPRQRFTKKINENDQNKFRYSLRECSSHLQNNFTKNSNLLDLKSELKSRIVKAILSSNETIEREKAYRKQYEQQLKHHNFKNIRHQRTSPQIINQTQKRTRLYRQIYPFSNEKIAEKPKQISNQFQENPMRITINNQSKTPQAYMRQKCRNYTTSPSKIFQKQKGQQETNLKQKNYTNNQRRNQKDTFFKEFSGSMKVKEAEQIRPWLISEENNK